MQGVRFGNYFWILGGYNSLAWGSWIPQDKTSIWTVEKEKWIQGPKVPILLFHSPSFCATAINSTFVMFIGMLDSVVTYDFTTEIWSNIKNPWNITGTVCNTVQDKQAKT